MEEISKHSQTHPFLPNVLCATSSAIIREGGLWVKVRKPLPTGRQAFGLGPEDYVKFLSPTT